MERLRSAGIPALSVDRYQFREMIESASGQELWSAGAVSALSREFARQEDIGEALAATRWDLLIVDEAHQFRGTLSGRVLRHVAEAADRVVLASATALDTDLPGDFAKDDISVVQWRRDEVVDFNGALLDSMPRPIVREVPFTLSAAELSLAESVSELCQVFEEGTAQQHLIRRSSLRSLQSSPSALESALARIREIRNRAVHAMEPLPVSSDEEPLEDRWGVDIDTSVALEASRIASRALDSLEAVGSDSKLAALAALLGTSR